MMNNFNVEYVRINRENANKCTDFMDLGYEYMKEVAPDMSLEIHNKFLNSILKLQNEKAQKILRISV